MCFFFLDRFCCLLLQYYHLPGICQQLSFSADLAAADFAFCLVVVQVCYSSNNAPRHGHEGWSPNRNNEASKVGLCLAVFSHPPHI